MERNYLGNLDEDGSHIEINIIETGWASVDWI
jgi:hypothetical protein